VSDVSAETVTPKEGRAEVLPLLIDVAEVARLRSDLMSILPAFRVASACGQPEPKQIVSVGEKKFQPTEPTEASAANHVTADGDGLQLLPGSKGSCLLRWIMRRCIEWLQGCSRRKRNHPKHFRGNAMRKRHSLQVRQQRRNDQ